MRKTVSFAACAGLLAWSAGAGAQQLENPRTDYTAYTRPRGRASIGFLKADLAVIDEVLIGTYPLPWFVFPYLKATVPSVYAKVRSPWSGPLTLSLSGSFMYIDGKSIAQLGDSEASASAVSTTGSIDASFRFDKRFSLSLGFDYANLRAVGNTQREATSVEGASAAQTYSTRLLSEWRLTRVFALSVLLRALIYQSPVSVDGTANDEAVTITSDLSAEPTKQARFTAVPGVSFEWERWEANAGVGYGVLYLPALGLATTNAVPVVDFAFAYRFDIYH